MSYLLRVVRRNIGKIESMCPICITTTALVVAGATSTGGVSALVARKLSGKNRKKEIPGIPKRKKF
jgi:hypothetical protein